MRAAAGTKDFVAIHSEAVVLYRRDDPRDKRFCETGPTGARLEFRVAREQWRVAAGAVKHSATMFGQQNRGSGAFGRMAAQDCILLRGQLLFPFGVGLLDFRNGGEIFSGRFQWFHIFDGVFAGFLSMRLPGKIEDANREGGEDNEKSESGIFHKESHQRDSRAPFMFNLGNR